MTKAFVLIRVKLGEQRTKYIKSIVEGLTSMEDTKEVRQIYGIYDIIVKLQSENIKELRKSCFEAVDYFGVQSHMTHVVVDEDDEEGKSKTSDKKNVARPK